MIFVHVFENRLGLKKLNIAFGKKLKLQTTNRYNAILAERITFNL